MLKLKLILLSVFILLSVGNSVISQWVQINSGVNTSIKKITFNNIQTGYFVTNDQSHWGYLRKTTNSASNWDIIFSPGSEMYNIYMPAFSNGFACGPHHVWVTSDNGNTWLDRYMENYEIFDVRFQNSYTAYAVGWKMDHQISIMVRSSDAGINWNMVFAFQSDHNKIFCIRFPDEITGYACGENGYMLKVKEGITNWTKVYTGYSSNFNYMHFFNPNTGIVVGNSTALLKTTNGGYPWFEIWTGFSGVDLKAIQFVDNSTGYVIGSGGFIAKSTDGGQTWGIQNSPVISNLNSIYMMNKDTVYISGENGVILRTFNGGVISVNLISSNIPKSISLYQNYPNPFNPSTSIKFDISRETNVKLIVFDALGRQTALLVNEKLPAGEYSVDFDGFNYSSGIYYYKILAEDFTMTKKMILIK